tara:strand:- start:1356 stop:2372 length:1017 start_codon:yes stop_codon:yes gene_type:complete
MNNKRSKDADYIELKKSEYKNKKSIFWLILLMVPLLFIIFFLFLDDKFFNGLKNAFFLSKQKESSKISEIDYEAENLDNNEIMGIVKERDLQHQILEKKNDDNKEKINSLENKISNLQKLIENLPLQSSINPSEKTKFLLLNKVYLNLLLLNKKLLSDGFINKELKFLKSYFLKNENITILLQYFESIDRAPLNKVKLIIKLDDLIHQFNSINLNTSDKVFSDSNWQQAIKSKDSFKKNLMNFIDTNFKIKKIDQSKDLNDYANINNDGQFEIVNSLMDTRSRLLLNDLRGAKTNLEEISSPLTYELEMILEKINELIIFNENLQKLEEEILESLIKI